jgi:ankyrin repeat protein
MNYLTRTLFLAMLAIHINGCHSPHVVDAIHDNDERALARYLKGGGSPDATVKEGKYSGMSLLMVACRENRADMAKRLILAGANINPWPLEDTFQYPLGEAMKHRNRDLLKFMISHGAKVPDIENKDTDPLLLAVISGDHKRVSDLSQLPAYTDRSNYRSTLAVRNALNFATYLRDEKAIGLLLDNCSDALDGHTAIRSPLMTAIYKGQLDELTRLLEQGSPVNEGMNPHYSFTPLLIATQLGNVELVKLLLEKGAKPDVYNRDIGTPCKLAVENNDLEILRILLEKGANPNYMGRRSFSPLMLAIVDENQKAVQLLLKFKADKNLKGHMDDTPVSLAKRLKRRKIEALLLQN